MSDEGSTLPDDGASESSTEVAVALLLEGYLSDLEAGRPADPERLIAAHPHLAGPLRACLEVMCIPMGAAGGPGPTGGAGNDPRGVYPARPQDPETPLRSHASPPP